MSLQQGLIQSLTDLPHGREMQDYLIDLAAAMTGKKKPPSDFIHKLTRDSDIFIHAGDMEDILEQVRHIYRTAGYRNPWDLENDLIRHYHPGISDITIAISDIYTAAELSLDHLTGYHHKTQVPLAMGFSALYAQATGNPVTVLEIDYSNMRGTNDHFAKVIAVAESKSQDAIIYDAMGMTDYMSYALAQTILKTLQNNPDISPDAAFIPLRTGGDEARIVMANFSLADAQKILPQVHAAIEHMTARAGLHDHPHTKRPNDPLSRGFGACGAVFELKAEGHNQYSEAIRKADEQIQKEKMQIGIKRLNNLAYDQMRPACGKQPDLYDSQTMATDYYTHVMSIMSELHQYNIILNDIELDARPTLEAISEELQPAHFLTPKDIQLFFQTHLSEELKEHGILLTTKQAKAIEIKSTRFPTLDYASGTLVARDFPAMAGAALQVVNDISTRTRRNDPIWTLGVSFHNLAGLNDALGHEFANTILRHQANQIIEQSCFKLGIAQENMILSHMGGGEFRAIIQPYIQRPDGTNITIDATIMDQVEKEITARTKTLNGINIKNFAVINSIQLESTNLPETFGDILNPRTTLRPYENGIVATICTQSYKNAGYRKQAGGALVAFIGDHLEKAVQDRRQSMLPVPSAPVPKIARAI